MGRMAGISVLHATLLSFASLSTAQIPPFTVTRPDSGDTLVLSQYSGSNELYVEWTLAPGTEDQPALIALQRGEDVGSLETIENVNSTAPNNGSYTWAASDSVSLKSGTNPWLARTACNYTIRLSVDGLVAYSQYFTIINEKDGPVPDSATCPIERGVARPAFANPEADSTVLDSDAEAGGERGGNGGISSSTLAVAIVVPIVVLLIVFGLLLWFGLRRGWFVKWIDRRKSKSHLTHDNTAGIGGHEGQHQQQQSQVVSPVAEKGEDNLPPYGSPPQELHSEHRAWEAEGQQVYQLEGDERDARLGDGNVRESRV